MGRKKNRDRQLSSNEAFADAAAAAADGIDEEDVIDVLPKIRQLDRYLHELFHKTGSKREAALTTIIESLRNKVEHEFVEEKFATLLYRFVFSVKKGSSKEIHFAVYAIGLLALITHGEDNAHEIYEESIPLLSELLKSKSKSPTIFQCLAIVTLFGTQNVDETESTMQFVWQFINSESDSDPVTRKYSADVVAAAISCWSLLLSSMDQWKFSLRYWQGAISCFLNLLEDKDDAVCVAAGEALALIFESGSIEKFSSKCDTDGSTLAQAPSNYAMREKAVKDKVLNKLLQLSVIDDENSAELNFVQAHSGDWDVIKFFKDGNCPEILVKIGKHHLSLPSWSRKIQQKCFERFLGKSAFIKHMLENELLQDFFDFRPTKKNISGTELYEPPVDKIRVLLYLPPDKTNPENLMSGQIKSIRNARLSATKKAKTKLLKKHRSRAEMRDNDTIFGS